MQNAVRRTKGRLETDDPEVVRGALQAQLDTIALHGQFTVPDAVALISIGARRQRELLAPNQAALAQGLQAVVANARIAAWPDLWTPRTLAIAPDARASEVVVAVWDSAVSILALFRPAAAQGLAVDEAGRPATDLL